MNAAKKLGLLLGLLACGSPAAFPGEPKRLDSFDVLSFHVTESESEPAVAPAQWLKRRREILLAMQDVMGPLPGANKRCPLEVRVEEETDCGSYVRRLISYASEPGARTPAYLCIPKAALNGQPAPAFLCLHPTENSVGF